MTPAQQQAELGRRLSVIDRKLAKAWDRLTGWPQTGSDLTPLVEQYEALSDRRVELRRACRVPA
jgi:hypothetical protein